LADYILILVFAVIAMTSHTANQTIITAALNSAFLAILICSNVIIVVVGIGKIL
jgi:hypothetical protein